jgi:hypothetical protein
MTARPRLFAVNDPRGGRWLTVALLLLLLACLHGGDAAAGTPGRPGDAAVTASLLDPAVSAVHADDAHARAPRPPSGEHHHDERPAGASGTCLLFMTAAIGWLGLLSTGRLLRIERLAGPLLRSLAARPRDALSLTELCILRT